MGLTSVGSPARLFDILDDVVTAADTPKRAWRAKYRTVAWFNAPQIRIGDRVWAARREDRDGFAYTLHQAREMRAALLPVMAAAAAGVEATARALFGELEGPAR